MILIDGPSWAMGEFERGDIGSGLKYPGLEPHFEKDGFKCKNLASPLASNLRIAHRLEGWLSRHPDANVTSIFVMLSDWTLDSKMIFDEDFDNITSVDDLCNIYLARYYNKLSNIAVEYKVQVHCIGAMCDHIWLDKFSEYYPGVNILCQSLVNLMLNDTHRIENPVHSIYKQESLDILNKLKPYLSDEQKGVLLDRLDEGMQREDLVFGNPEYFWPDGCHANRKAFLKLYDFIKHQLHR